MGHYFFVEHFNCMQRRQWYENVQERKIQIGLTKIRLPVMINITNKWPESPVVASSVVAVVSCLAVWSLITRSWSHFIISIYLPSRAAIMTAGVRAGRGGGRRWAEWQYCHMPPVNECRLVSNVWQWSHFLKIPLWKDRGQTSRYKVKTTFNVCLDLKLKNHSSISFTPLKKGQRYAYAISGSWDFLC